MQISSETIGEPLINLSVSGATIEDYIAFAPEALAKLQANHVFIVADPWIINKFNNLNGYNSVKHLYDYWLDIVEQNKPLNAYFAKII